MQKACSLCGSPFEIMKDDLAYYEKISPTFGGKKFPMPAPEECPDCRHARRMAFRNERHLYKRSCDHCKQSMLSIYDADAPFPVYCHTCWWGDNWDAREYGIAYDASQSFFDQFQELLKRVPRLGIVTGHNENCDYCNYVNYSKDSYLCFGCHAANQCYHCWRVHWSESCVDCLQLDKGTLCYECIDCDDCYELLYSQDCTGCRDSAFLYDCRGCSNCLFCSGLRNVQYHIFNEKYSPEEFERKQKEMALHTNRGMQQSMKVWKEHLAKRPHRHAFILNSENVRGDHIMDSRNLYECYHVKNAQDCRYLESCENIKDSVDNTFSGWPGELIFETMSAGVNCYNVLFSTTCWSCSNLLYCDSCHHSQDLFGCIALRQKNQYCILNKQYSKEEYDRACSQILEQMMARKEFGRFFPSSISPHAYNETAAMEFYPLTEQEAKKRGWRWLNRIEEKPAVTKIIPGSQLPETIDAVPDDVLQWAIECETTHRPFRIIKQELDFHRRVQLPLPRLHPDERHRRRMSLRNPRKLWKRNCAKCRKEIGTTYSPDRSEIIFCEECYLKEVY